MARAGRKRKVGPRTESGRLSRAGATFDKGTERAQEKLSVYGTDGSDAIGRAYQAGLLPHDADALRDTARSLFRAYWPMLGQGQVRCSLGDGNGGAANDDLLDRDTLERRIANERRLTDQLKTIDRMGREYRRAFDQLCIDINPDCGPAWLDQLLEAKQGGGTVPIVAIRTLKRAIEAIRAVQ